jgi:radical SAM protein with 4Fe4S-binding SPASM domain
MKIQSDSISIETTNLCPAHCTICPREKFKQKLGIMGFDLFKKIIDDTSQYGITTIDCSGFGDPFTDKLFFKRCQYIRDKMPKTAIYASSNCFLMTPDIYPEVIEYIDTLKMSIYGLTRDIYEKSHGGCLKQEATYSNILGLLKKMNLLKKKPYTIGLLTVSDINQHEMSDWIKFWQPKLNEIYVWRPHNFGDGRNYRKIDHKYQVSCGRPLGGPLYIQVDGTVSVCCFDINKKLVIGDMKTQTIEEVLHSESYEEIRKSHRDKNFKGSLCYNCDQTNSDPSVLLYASNKQRSVGKLTTNLKDIKPK